MQSFKDFCFFFQKFSAPNHFYFNKQRLGTIWNLSPVPWGIPGLNGTNYSDPGTKKGKKKKSIE